MKYLLFVFFTIIMLSFVILAIDYELQAKEGEVPYAKYITKKPVPYTQMLVELRKKRAPNLPPVAIKDEKGMLLPDKSVIPADVIRQYDWDADNMIKIMQCESGGNRMAHAATRWEHSVGLFQINVAVHPYKHDDMYDIEKNIAAAYNIYMNEGYYAWKNCSKMLGLI